MYRIILQKNGSTIGIVDAPRFIKYGNNGCLVDATRENAVGIAYKSTPYNLVGHNEINGADTVVVKEIDGGDVYMGMEEVNNITFVALAETKVLDDDTAARYATVFPSWAVGVDYKVGRMRTDPLNGKLYRVREGQAHTSVEGWNPSLTPAMWELVDVTHSGAIGDPIPYDSGMELFEGLYYSQNGVVYRCTRSTGAPVYHELSALIGIYVEVVT